MEEGELEKLFGNFSFKSLYTESGRHMDTLIERIPNHYGELVLVTDTHYREKNKENENTDVIDLTRVFVGILRSGSVEEQYGLENISTGQTRSFFYSDLINMFVVESPEDSEAED